MKSQEKVQITTIKLTKKTKERLDKLRAHKRDSYEEILQRTLGILNLVRQEPDEAQEKLENLEKERLKNKLN